MDFVGVVLAIDDAFAASGVAYAFGGALALGAAATPRGTVDIDLNVFVPPADMAPVVETLRAIGYESPPDVVSFVGGQRFTSDASALPIDVFPSLDSAYDEIARRVVRKPFGPDGRLAPFLSAEDICLFKLSFGRPKDWVDLEALAAVPRLDVGYIERQLIALRGPTMHPRLARFRSLAP